MSDGVGRAWSLHAHDVRGTYWHVGERRWVEMHGLTHPIVPVIAREHIGDARDPKVTHYGWEYANKPGRVAMIWPRASGREDISPWMLLGMCFTYGMQAEIDAGKGKMVALRITQGALVARESATGPTDLGDLDDGQQPKIQEEEPR